MQPLPEGTSLLTDLKVVDLSDLTLDKRACTHLRKAGLRERQALAAPKSVQANVPVSNSARGGMVLQGTVKGTTEKAGLRTSFTECLKIFFS